MTPFVAENGVVGFDAPPHLISSRQAIPAAPAPVEHDLGASLMSRPVKSRRRVDQAGGNAMMAVPC